ncbi:ParB/RepB/Spo0J family partition protein [Salisediminibacterium beveridgei]|uniref:Chromosome (Plasmid) partitioning protein ParB / Stage 0 sporulation protein J n=1 Tax=Salisediminibacterium beveridgei TaxID=632773 RepID=A0A1D7QQX6_9BACI|nr:ParB/RepB/Spo0J family partition protein [Salisediminibacterium beveridgei]AOM81417.1 Chromosome (plasmid) partitioning protein ParB / Stage 0 sporulation protein J [Salisediminibacterium beveridgei]
MGKGLGKGIGAFFPDSERYEEHQDKGSDQIKLKDLRPNPYQPRKHFDDEAIDELKQSIEQHGVLQPIVVRKSIKGYEIVVGERRYRAAKLAKLETIPAIVRDLTDDEMMELALIENLQREDLNPLEEAKAYKKLMEHLSLTQDQLSAKLGKSRPHIANYLRLLQAPQIVQQYLQEEKISTGHARALLGLKDEQKLSPLLQKTIKEQWSVRHLESVVQEMNENVSRETIQPKEKMNPYLKDRETFLKSYLGTNVLIKPGKKKSKIEIDYFSDDDLERIVSLLGAENTEE